MTLRHWSVRRARQMEWLYLRFENIIARLHPLFLRIGYARLEKPVAFVEKIVKGVLFDCQMCGRCVLSSTGMSCPMNCPKQLRNGPCGGVRANGNCEVIADMPCVWVEAHRGNLRMRKRENFVLVQPPVDWSRRGGSSWLHQVRTLADKKAATEKE